MEIDMGSFSDWIMVLVTCVYSFVTYKILKANEKVVLEMKNQQEAFTRPYMSVGVVALPTSQILYLKVKNRGNTPAYNVRMTLDRDFYQFAEKNDGKNLKNKPAFSESIDMIQQDAELWFYLAQGFVFFGKDYDETVTPKKFNVKVEYNYLEKTIVEDFAIDLSPYSNSVLPQDPVVTSLENIAQSVRGIKL
jgi:hypothetical protein